MHYLTKLITGIVILCLLLVTIFPLYKWYSFLYAPLLSHSEDVVYTVAAGSTLYKVAHDLHDKGWLKNPKYFILLGDIKKQTKNLKAGEYCLKAQSRPFEILQQLTKGKVIQYSIVFIEGWTFSELRHVVAENTVLQHQLTYLDDQQLMSKIGKPGQSAEGMFFPDTYYFTRGTSDVDLLKRAYSAMQKKLSAAWQSRATNLPYKTPFEALIVASMVEKESAVPEERPLIAGVILQRLKKKMLLQIDPTVIYGMGEHYIGTVLKSDLKMDSPYNTYRYHGLPPTPIALPSEQSLIAALHPQVSGYLYFVAKGDGGHYFSKTLAEQQQAIKKYLRH